jgi:twitching motility protein PilT
VFPGRQKIQIRGMVSESLRGVISQQLIPTADGRGRVAAFELMLTDRPIANLIREGKTFQLPNAIRLGRSRGMCAMDDSILELITRGLITPAAGLEHASNPEALRKSIDANRPPTAPASPARATPVGDR